MSRRSSWGSKREREGEILSAIANSRKMGINREAMNGEMSGVIWSADKRRVLIGIHFGNLF